MIISKKHARIQCCGKLGQNWYKIITNSNILSFFIDFICVICYNSVTILYL